MCLHTIQTLFASPAFSDAAAVCYALRWHTLIPDEQITESTFERVSQFNSGASAIESQQERKQVASVTLITGIGSIIRI